MNFFMNFFTNFVTDFFSNFFAPLSAALFLGLLSCFRQLALNRFLQTFHENTTGPKSLLDCPSELQTLTKLRKIENRARQQRSIGASVSQGSARRVLD